MAESLKGLIERVTFHNPENGFAVLKVQVKGRQDLVKVTDETPLTAPAPTDVVVHVAN